MCQESKTCPHDFPAFPAPATDYQRVTQIFLHRFLHLTRCYSAPLQGVLEYLTKIPDFIQILGTASPGYSDSQYQVLVHAVPGIRTLNPGYSYGFQ